jgi:hypothetical protein
MNVLKATEEQKNSLEGKYLNCSELIFFKDKNDNWIVGENVKIDPDFIQAWPQLESLEIITYNPKED